MIWKELDEVYKVSEYGDVRSQDRVIQRGSRKHSIKGKVLTHNICKNGYHRVGINKDSKTQYKAVHRLVAKLFVDNPENKPEVNHIDGDKSNNHYTNLEWVTRSENMKHAVDKGLVTHLIKESEAQKKLIYQFDKEGNLLNKFESLSQASASTGISKPYISQLCTGARKVQKHHEYVFSHYRTPFAEEVTE